MTVLWGPGRFLPVIASSIAASVLALNPYGFDGSNGKPPRRLDANTNMRMALLGDVLMDVVPLIWAVSSVAWCTLPVSPLSSPSLPLTETFKLDLR